MIKIDLRQLLRDYSIFGFRAGYYWDFDEDVIEVIYWDWQVACQVFKRPPHNLSKSFVMKRYLKIGDD